MAEQAAEVRPLTPAEIREEFLLNELDEYTTPNWAEHGEGEFAHIDGRKRRFRVVGGRRHRATLGRFIGRIS